MAPIVTQFARIYPERNAEVPAGSYGTEGTPTYKDLRILTDDIDGGPLLTPEYDASNAFGHSDVDDSGSRYSGGLTSKTRVDELTLLYLAHFGKVVTTGAGPEYTHIFTPLDDLTLVAPSLGLDLGVEKKRMYKYHGVLVNEINISKVNAGEVNHSYDIIAKSRETAAYPTGYAPTYSALKKLMTVNLATLHGQAIVWESLSIRMNRNWDGTLAFNGRTIPDAEIGLFTAEIEGVVKFENANPIFVDVFEAGTEGELTIDFRGDAIGGSFQTLKLEFDRVKILSAPPPHINADRKTQSIKAQVLIPTAGDWAKVTIINAVASPASYP